MKTLICSIIASLTLTATPAFAEREARVDETETNASVPAAPRIQVAQRFNLVVGDFQCEAYWQTFGGRGYYTQFRTQFAGSTVQLRNQALAFHQPRTGVQLADVTCEDTTQGY